MKIARVLIFAIALINFFFGGFALVATDKVAELVSLVPGAPHAHGEMRAVFGGLVAALGAMLAIGAADPRYRSWLGAAGMIFGGLALGRLVSLFADGVETYTLVTLAFEGGSAALCWFVARERCEVPAPSTGRAATSPAAGRSA